MEAVDFSDDIELKDNINLLIKYLNVLTKREREIIIDRYGLDNILRKLIPLRQKYINELLRKKLRQWRDIANAMDKTRIKITKILRRLIGRKNETEVDKLRRILKKWRDNAEKIARESAKKRIARCITT